MNIEAALADLGVGESDRLGAAVSGGADSVAMLHLLARTRRAHVLHVEHGLRDESRDDARFVSQLARDLGLPCSVLCVDVDAQHASPEAAAREARYAALEAEAACLGLAWVATAHTRDDQAETVLMRAIRGSGVGGLGGIPRVRGIFVRPLLELSRANLRGWLAERGLPWREDASNADARYERNWIRHELMPLIERRRPGASRALARLAAHARADDETLEALASEVVEAAPRDDAGILLERLEALPRPVATRAVRQSCWALGETPTHDEVREILARDGARCGGLVARRMPPGIAILREPLRLPRSATVNSATQSHDWGVRLRLGPARSQRWTWRTSVPDERLVIRSRRPGDRVRTTAGTRKVSDVLMDAKIPRALRDFVPVLATESRAVAVVGFTQTTDGTGMVVDAEPFHPSWTRAAAWNRA